MPVEMDLLDMVSHSMNEYIKPKPDIFAVRSWRSQALYALVMHPFIKAFRDKTLRKLSAELADILGFIGEDETNDIFAETISNQIIDPALKLNEKMITSSRDFNFDFRISNPGETFSGDLNDLSNLDCIDIVANNRKFVVEKLNPKPDLAELRGHLHMVCSIYPSMTITEYGGGELMERPELVCKERMLVAWILKEKQWDSVLQTEKAGRSWLAKLLSTV
ncbi:hypothetical protein GGR54DRAFT_590530 [Hypoxylon sp. NC1633]|nr:hypothetical protein GGR54DRAFT_590530 [Hypoxylon sp. NC1633]